MSNKNSILLTDPEFDPNTAADCSLLLKISSDSFSYAIIDKNSRQLKVVFDQQECLDVAQDLAFGLKNDAYLTLPFKEIKVSVYTVNSIAIPAGLYDASNLNTYSKYFTEEQSDQLHVQPFARFGFNSIFTFQQFMEDTLTNSLQNCKKYDHAAPALTLAGTRTEDTLILDFTAGSFNALLMKDQKLVFHNYFEIENAEEFNYYLLLMLKQLSINKEATLVALSGIIHQDDEYYSILAKYFSRIELSVPVNNEIDHTLLEDMPAHYYTSLLALDLCE